MQYKFSCDSCFSNVKNRISIQHLLPSLNCSFSIYIYIYTHLFYWTLKYIGEGKSFFFFVWEYCQIYNKVTDRSSSVSCSWLHPFQANNPAESAVDEINNHHSKLLSWLFCIKSSMNYFGSMKKHEKESDTSILPKDFD